MLKWPWSLTTPSAPSVGQEQDPKPKDICSIWYEIRYLHICGNLVDPDEKKPDKPCVTFCPSCGTEGTWTKVVQRRESWFGHQWDKYDKRWKRKYEDHPKDRTDIAPFPIPDGTTYDTEESDLLFEELKSKTMRSNYTADFWTQVWPKVKRAQ